jgi:hypothetical protein
MQAAQSNVVVSVYKEDIAWIDRLRQLGYPVLIYTKGDANSPYSVPVNKGNEASAFLKYIVDHYDTLPEHSVFLHGEERSIHHDGSLVDILQSTRGHRCFYKNLNNYKLTSFFLPMIPWCDEFLGPELGPIENYGDWTQGHDGCAQFIVHRAAIQLRSRRFYSRIYDWLLSTPLQNYLNARYLEWTWHLIFGQVPQFTNAADSGVNPAVYQVFRNLEAYPLISKEVLDSVTHLTDEDFVKSLYASLAQREPTWPEFANQVLHLRAGLSRQNVALDILLNLRLRSPHPTAEQSPNP